LTERKLLIMCVNLFFELLRIYDTERCSICLFKIGFSPAEKGSSQRYSCAFSALFKRTKRVVKNRLKGKNEELSKGEWVTNLCTIFGQSLHRVRRLFHASNYRSGEALSHRPRDFQLIFRRGDHLSALKPSESLAWSRWT
jgi:hypothetical protein